MELYDQHGNYLVGGQLKLETRKKRLIPNDLRQEVNPASLKSRRDGDLQAHSSARSRSMTAVYNCMGMVFGARRTSIEPEELEMILLDDEYKPVPTENALVQGDIVVYKDSDGEPSHVGFVANVRTIIDQAKLEITVLSQWGQHGEYFHRIDDVPELLGKPTEYWTDRR